MTAGLVHALFIRGVRRENNFGSLRGTVFAHTQLVGRFQQFFTKPGATNGSVPGADTKEPEVGLNYYFLDGLRATGSYGRQLSSAGNANIWTAGVTYRFAFPLGRGGY